MQPIIICAIIFLISLEFEIYGQTEHRGIRPVPTVKPSGITKAVVIGISDYKHIIKLAYADDDAKKFAEFLKTLPNVASENITLILDSAATKSTSESAIYWALKSAQPGDQVIIYFAGHGDSNTADISLVESGYLLCHGVEVYTDYEISQAIKVNTIQEWVEGATKKDVFVVLVIDACRSGEFLSNNRSSTVKAALTALVKDWSNSIKMISCQPDQLSYEGEQWGGGHGVFTYYLLKGLKETALSNKNQEIIFYDLFKYVQDSTSKATGRRQIPSSSGNLNNIFLNHTQVTNVLLENALSKDIDPFISPSQHIPDTSATAQIELNEDSLLNVGFKRIIPINSFNLNEGKLDDTLKNKIQNVLDIIANGDYLNISVEQMQEAILCTEVLMEYFKLIPNEQEELLTNQFFFKGYLIIIENDRKEFSKAMELFQQIRINQPSSAYIFNAIGTLHSLQENYDSALYYFSKGKELAINWPEPTENMLDVYIATNQHDQAVEIALENIKDFPIRNKSYTKLEDLTEYFISRDSRLYAEIPHQLDSIKKELDLKYIDNPSFIAKINSEYYNFINDTKAFAEQYTTKQLQEQFQSQFQEKVKIEFGQLPEAVKTSLQSFEYGMSDVESVFEISSEEGTYYKITFADGTSELGVYFNEEGKIVEQ